jgi:hypothetical protein
MPDPDVKKTRQIDVAAFGRDHQDRDTLLAIGEAKRQETITDSHLKKLEHVRDLLLIRGNPGAETARLLLFSGTGFSDAIVKRAEDDPTIQLMGLDRLYHGSAPKHRQPNALSPSPRTRSGELAC